MTSHPQGFSQSERDAEQAAEAAYRDHVARLVLSHVETAAGESALVKDAVHQLMDVTGMSLSTVRNWFRRRSGMPDLASMARIVARWSIAPEEVFPPNLLGTMRLSTQPAEDQQCAPTHGASASVIGEAAVLLLSGRNDALSVKAGLQRYSATPEALILVRQEGTDSTGVVEHGELMLVDASVERIIGSGFYVLRVPGPGGRTSLALRSVQPLLGREAVRVSAASQSLASFWEEVALGPNGSLQNGITILGKMVGRLQSL
jgi:hypothetical protein